MYMNENNVQPDVLNTSNHNKSDPSKKEHMIKRTQRVLNIQNYSPKWISNKYMKDMYTSKRYNVIINRSRPLEHYLSSTRTIALVGIFDP